MIDASYSWKSAHREILLPETFVEINLTVADDITGQWDQIVVTNPAIFRNSVPIVQRSEVLPPAYYATLEENLWVLDGTRRILPDPSETGESPGDYYDNTGFVSNDNTVGRIKVTFDHVRETITPGLTITWSSEYDEYPTSFTVEALVDDTVISSHTVTGNNSNVSQVDFELTGYNTIRVTWNNWSLPNHRYRMDQIFFGHILVFDKQDIISYTHEQSGDLLSAALPKNSVSFSLNNTDGRWNPNNPVGIGKYLTERQKLTVRYGMDLDGEKEWVAGGKFYLSEWNAPSNGLEAQFVARDVFEFFLNKPSGDYIGLTIAEVVSNIVKESGLSENVWVYADPSIADTEWIFDTEMGMAENVQMIANQYRCVFWQDRVGDIRIMPLDTTISSYPILLEYAYSHPEITLSKPLKEVVVKYTGNADTDEDGVPDEATHTLRVADTGESQTVTNKRITSKTEAQAVAEWVRDTLASRKMVSGEFRADPRLDVFDIVEVESKYGTITPVAITNIKYTYNGSFRGHYEGRVIVIPEVE